VFTRHSSAAILIAFGSLSTVVYSQEKEKAPPAPTQDAEPPKASQRIRIGGKVMEKQLKRKVTPDYPREARDQRIQGAVRLHIVVSKEGKVLQAEIVSGHPVLAEAAVDAVRKWEYKPVLLNGQPVEVDSTVDVVFSLVQ